MDVQKHVPPNWTRLHSTAPRKKRYITALHLMRLRFFIPAISLLLGGVCFAQSDMPAADSSSLDFKQWGLLAIQDGGRRKPIDTFARETLIRTTGRSSYTESAARSGRRTISFCRCCSKPTIGRASR